MVLTCVWALPMQLFVGMILVLIFAEVLGLYGLIVALILSTKGQGIDCHLPPVNVCCKDGHLVAGGAGGEKYKCVGNV